MSSIEQYLADVPSGRLLPGAEPFYYPPKPEQVRPHPSGRCCQESGVGCLLLHGWGGTPHSMRYLGQRLQTAGVAAFAPLLPGAGTSAADLARTRAADWVHAAEDHLLALHELFPRTFVAGLSMGAILSLFLGASKPQMVRGLVAINGGVSLHNPEIALAAFRRDLPEVVPSWDEGWLLKDRSVVEVAYREQARTTIVDLLGLAKAVEELLPSLCVPVLILQSRQDRVVPFDNAAYMVRRIGSADKRVVVLEDSYHVATMDYDRDLVADEILAFMRSLVAESRRGQRTGVEP